MKIGKLLTVLMVIVLLLAGCTKNEASVVVATVNGEKITYEEFHQVYDYYLEVYGITDPDDPANADTIAYFRTGVLDALIAEKVQMIKAKELGVDTINDEEKAQVADTLAEVKASWEEYFTNDVNTNQPTLTEAEKKSEVKKQLDAYIEETGYTDEYITKMETMNIVLGKLFDTVTANLAFTDEDLKVAYDQQVASDKELYDNDLSSYEQALMSDTPVYYHPAGCRRIKHILIMLPQEDQDAISELRDAGDDAGADAKREEALKGIEATAKGVLDEIATDGANFDEIMNKYTEDTGIASFPDGYVVAPNSTSFMPEFGAGAFALGKVGDYSGLVPTDFGYHILRWEEDIPTRTVPFEDVKDTMRVELEETKKQELFDEKLTEWNDSMTIERFEDRL